MQCTAVGAQFLLQMTVQVLTHGCTHGCIVLGYLFDFLFQRLVIFNSLVIGLIVIYHIRCVFILGPIFPLIPACKPLLVIYRYGHSLTGHTVRRTNT